MKKLCDLIKLDKYTHKIKEPFLTLMTRNFDIIGVVSKYTKWNISYVGNGLDEISFEVHKYYNDNICPIWNELTDFKIIDVDGCKRFEIKVDYADSNETIKNIHGVSLETELGQLYLNDFHINDEEATGAIITEYNKKDFDSEGNFIPTVFCNFKDTEHSLLHRVIKDKAPHWSVDINNITEYITMSEEDDAISSNKFQREYTVNGETIYDFLTGKVSEESNVIFIFDTINRKIGCYCLDNCYITQENGKRLLVQSSIGEDTKILISKKKLANNINISSNKDSVKNCFRVEGGDDIITDMVRAVNMNGSNYIYQFADFQYNDMPENLSKAIKEYQKLMSNKKDEYYGKQGIFTRLCDLYERLEYLKSKMMPTISVECQFNNAREQYEDLKCKLSTMTVGVSSINKYDNNLFAGITNNIDEIANTIIDSRYSLKIINGTTSYNNDTNQWTGVIQITKISNETDFYPKADNTNTYDDFITIKISDDTLDPLNLPYTKQKIDIALAKGDMSLVDYDAEQLSTDNEKYEYFNQYCQSKLQSFVDGYNSCLSVLMSGNIQSEIKDALYSEYKRRYDIVCKVLEHRNSEILIIENGDAANGIKGINDVLKEQAQFQKDNDFYLYLENIETGLYKKFCVYRREETYCNNNYISDNAETSTSELINRTQQLINSAETELKKACVLQRTITTSLNNLFLLPEFDSLYESFNLYNYIRIDTEDEILKLRLIGVEINGDSIADIDVTFAEQIESIDKKINDMASLLQQTASIATSYNATTLQAKQGYEARNKISEIYSNGLNAADTMLKNSDNNEVTISTYGILAKRMDDKGFYGNAQLRIIGNGIYMTNNNWETVNMAIGEILFTNPVTDETSIKYGVIADSIVGKIIVGENIVIGNDKGTVNINSDGIIIYNGNGTSDKDKVFYADNNGNLNLKAHIEAESGKIANFNISKNELYTDGSLFDNNIGLYFGEYGLKLGKYFRVTNDGILTTQSGKIANFIFDENALYTEDATYGTNGIYFGKYGLSLGTGFKIDNQGNFTSIGTINIANGNLTYSLKAGLVVKGNIQADGGSFSGNITSTATISGGKINGTQITNGTNFSVNEQGDLTCINANITGNINASFIKAKQSYYIYDSDLASFMKVISASLDSSSDTEYNFGRLSNNGYGSGLNYICFIDRSQDRICTLYSGLFNVNCDLDVKGTIESSSYIYAGKNIVVNSNYGLYNSDINNYLIHLFTSKINGTSQKHNRVGNSSLPTAIIGKDNIYSNTEITNISDERVKYDFKTLEKYENWFFKIEPISYKFVNGTSGRTHIGISAQSIKKSLLDCNLSTKDFAGYVEMPVDPELQEYINDDIMCAIRKEEFIMLNTHMIQKAYKIIKSQQEEINELKKMLNQYIVK